MWRSLSVIFVLALMIGACDPGEPASSTTSTAPSTTPATNTTTSSPGSTTSAAAESSTSTDATNTGTTATTTTTLAALTADPNLPSALSRSMIPWSQVGTGWYVVLYDPSRAYPIDASDIREGPIVLYLVDSDGNRYEITGWAAGDGPWGLVDATSTSALVSVTGPTVDDRAYARVDLATGVSTLVHTVGFPEHTYMEGPPVSLTRPTGANIVVHRSDGTDEWIERRSPGGALMATIFQQPYTSAIQSLAWMYGYSGTSVLVAHHGGIAEVSNSGVVLSDVWVPMDTLCKPMRWWDTDTFVAACYGQGPASAPDDGYGNPHTYYGRIWLLNTNGTAGVPMTTLPPMADVVDFGYHDMWPVGGDQFLKWSGDCGSSNVAQLQPDGTGATLPVSVPPSFIAHGVEMIDYVDGQLTLYGWDSCDMWVGMLFATDITGTYTHDLVPVVGDARGVTGVVGLAEVHP